MGVPWTARRSNQSILKESESEVAQSCLTLSDPMDCSLPCSSVHGIFQARVPEWVAIAFSDTEAYHVSNTSYIAEKVHFGTQFTERGLEHSSDFSRWKAALTGKGMDYSLRFIPQFCVCARALSRV